MREEEEGGREPEAPATEEHPEQEPSSLEDGRRIEPGQGPLDEPAGGGGTHRGW